MMQLPPAPQVRTTVYENFLGVDFSVDASMVKPRRSPAAFNLYSNREGTLVKRHGYEAIFEVAPHLGKYVDTFVFKFANDKSIPELISRCIVISEHSLMYGAIIKKDGEIQFDLKELLEYHSEKITHATGFYLRHKQDSGKYYIITSYDMFVCDDNYSLKKLEPYIPTVAIAKNETGGGVLYEDINLLTGYRTESFHIKNTSHISLKVSTKIDSVDGDVRGEYIDPEGNKKPLQITEFKDDVVKCLLPNAAPVEGEDNVFITYNPNKTDLKNKNKILGCKISTLYGHGVEDRVFVSGNSKYPSYDWWTAVGDPTYFPDTNYSIIGSGSSAIMGYHKIGEYLAIVKQESQTESTLFLRYAETIREVKNGTTIEKTAFRLKQSAVGIGASDIRSFAVVNDEPLFLSSKGVYAITSSLLGYERTLKNRSYFIDSRLNGVGTACEWNGFYVLGTPNGNVYLLDSKQKAGKTTGNDYVYECYHLTNIYAKKFFDIDGELYFMGEANSEDKRVYLMTFAKHGYADVVRNNRKPVSAQWATPNDNDGMTHMFKTLQKKGCLVTLAPHLRSGGSVYYIKDGDPEIFVKESHIDTFDWENIDFERFTFDSNGSPQEIYFKKKQKKYKRLQIIIRNNKDEPFGIYQIVKSYTVGNYSKNRGGI